jgi:hypothetical protein
MKPPDDADHESGEAVGKAVGGDLSAAAETLVIFGKRRILEGFCDELHAGFPASPRPCPVDATAPGASAIRRALIRGDEMTTDWLETEPAGTFTREQTLAVRRPAWVAASEAAGGVTYYFDGRAFFCRPRGGRRPVPAREAPETGWRHRRGCPCTLCRAAA